MDFISRHLGPDAAERETMLKAVGYDSVEALVDAALPTSIRATEALNLPEALSEDDAQAKLREYASQNVVLKSFYGQGYSDTLTPAVIRRGLLEDAGWYTAYTPYQPEISQGRLEALLNFQTMIESLTGLPIANASLLDEASATAEAVGLMARAVKKGRRVLLDSRLHPQVLAVAAERARAIELEVEIADVRDGIVGEDLVGAVLAYTGTEGDIVDPRAAIEELHTRGALAAVVADPLSLLLLEAPGEMGADVVLGSSQRFGVPLFLAARTRPSCPSRTSSSASCRAASWACPRMPPAAPPTAWPCRLVSSTSAASVRPPISVLPRPSWPMWPPCMPSTTAQRG